MTTPSFRDLGVPKKLNDALHKAGMRTPFPIQAKTIPHALDGRDLCGRAPTGSGKTLAFAIPAVENIESARPNHPRALILTPTRELANQVRETIQPLAQARNLWVGSFYGGTSVGKDISRLKRGIDIVVGTPGRLEDLIERGALKLDEVNLVIIDEADRMADMGFLPVVKRLLDQTSPKRQTLLFSATLDGEVDVLVKRYQNDPVRVEVETPEDELGHVNHLFWSVDKLERRQTTARMLREVSPAIVFTRTKHGADRLAKQLRQDGVETAAIHGNRSQNQREAALKRFARGEVTALIATDVAARGIHVDDVALVVHYDLPGTDKDYVHRSGRTGRAGARGTVVTLVSAEQHKDLRGMQRLLEMDEGLHDLRWEHLTADVVPSPNQGARAPQDRSDNKGGSRPSGHRSGSGRGNNQRRGGGPKGGSHGTRTTTSRDGQRSGGARDGQRSSNSRDGQGADSSREGQRSSGSRDGQRSSNSREGQRSGQAQRAGAGQARRAGSGTAQPARKKRR